jgi:cytoplasmic iron level regulating protein YaaA (DUF328/UPF0246 family)
MRRNGERQEKSVHINPFRQVLLRYLLSYLLTQNDKVRDPNIDGFDFKAFSGKEG